MYKHLYKIGMYKSSKQFQKFYGVYVAMLEFHVTMVVIIFQKSHIVVHVIIYMIFPFMDSQICNSLLDLKIYYDFKYIQKSYLWI